MESITLDDRPLRSTNAGCERQLLYFADDFKGLSRVVDGRLVYGIRNTGSLLGDHPAIATLKRPQNAGLAGDRLDTDVRLQST